MPCTTASLNTNYPKGARRSHIGLTAMGRLKTYQRNAYTCCVEQSGLASTWRLRCCSWKCLTWHGSPAYQISREQCPYCQTSVSLTSQKESTATARPQRCWSRSCSLDATIYGRWSTPLAPKEPSPSYRKLDNGKISRFSSCHTSP